MRPGLAWAALGILLPALGAPLLSHGAYRRYPLAARAGLSGAAGAVLLSTTMTAFALAGARWNVAAILALALAAGFGLRALLAGESEAPPEPRAADAVPMLSAIIAGAAVLIALAATVAGLAGSSDLLLFWGPKARAFASARSVDAAFLSDPRHAYMHPYYPPLVPELLAVPAMSAGRFSWSAAALTFPALLAVIALTLPALLRSSDRPFAPRAVSALVVAALALLGIEANVAGNADFFLLLFATLGAALLLGRPPLDRARRLLAGLLLAGAAVSKVEGLPLAAAAAVLFAVRAPSGRRLRAAGWLLAPTILALGLWFAFGARYRAFSGYGEYGSLLALRFDRLPQVVEALGRAFRDAGWGLPYLVPIVVALLSRGPYRGLPLAVAGVFAAFLLTTYLLPVPDPRSWIAWSAARTFAPVAVLLALSLAGRREGHAKSAIVTKSEIAEIQSPVTNDRGQ